MKTKKVITIGAVAFALFGCAGIQEKVTLSANDEAKRKEIKQTSLGSEKDGETSDNNLRSLAIQVNEHVTEDNLSGIYTQITQNLTYESSNFFQKSLSEWPIVDNLPSLEEKEFYNNKTWDSTLTLKANQEKLVNEFLKHCVDFSFQMVEFFFNSDDKPSPYGIGRIDSGLELCFLPYERGMKVESADNKGEIEIFYKKNNKIISIKPGVINCMCFSALGNMEQYQEQFKKYFNEIAQDPVGCWLLRVILSKMVVNKMPKITFMPASSPIGNTRPLSSIDFFSFQDIISKEIQNRIPIIIFNPNSLNKNILCHLVKIEDIQPVLFDRNLPIEFTVLHEIIRTIHNYMGELRTGVYDTIEKRNNFVDTSIGKRIYGNDEEYRIIFGLTPTGFDRMNVSFYLVSKYKFMPPGHSIFMGKALFDSEQSDSDLFAFYLSPDSPLQFPEFGVGDFPCSDLASKTGDPS